MVRKCAQYSTRNLSGAAAMMEATNVIKPHSPYLYLSPSHTQTNNKTRPRESFAHMLETCICLEGILAHKCSLTKTNTARTQTDATTVM